MINLVTVMELSLKMVLIACPMVFLAGFVDAIGGGGGLISLPGYLFAGLPAHAAARQTSFLRLLAPVSPVTDTSKMVTPALSWPCQAS